MVAAHTALAESLLGHEVSMLAHHSVGERDRAEGMIKNAPVKALVPVDLLPPPGRLDQILGRDTHHLLAQRIRASDMVVVHGLWTSTVRQAASIAWRSGVPYVILPHGMLDPWSLHHKGWKKRLALALAFRRILKRATVIQTTSVEEREGVQLLDLRVPVEVIPNGIFLEEVDPLPTKGTFYTVHPELEGRPFILFLGRLHHIKGLDFLVDAFQSLAREYPRLQLVLAGPDGGGRSSIEAQVQSLGLQERIRLVGPIYGRAKYAALMDAQCFCLPSRHENFGIVVAEAMATRTPVVISDQVQIWPEVKEAGAGLVVPLDAQALSKALAQVLGDDALRQRMGQAGRALVQERFAWPQIASQTIEAYQRHLVDTKTAARSR